MENTPSPFPDLSHAFNESMFTPQSVQRDGIMEIDGRYLKAVSRRLMDEGIELFVNLRVDGNTYRCMIANGEIYFDTEGLKYLSREGLAKVTKIVEFLNDFNT